MFGRWGKKYKNEISADDLEKEKKALDSASAGISQKFDLDRLEVKSAYAGRPDELKDIFSTAVSYSKTKFWSAALAVVTIGGEVAIRRPILPLLLIGVAAGANFFYTQSKMDRLKNKVQHQLEDHRYKSGRRRPPDPRA